MTSCAPQQSNHQSSAPHNAISSQPYNLASYLGSPTERDNQQNYRLQGYSHYETLPGATRDPATVHRHNPERPQVNQPPPLRSPVPPDRTIMATDIRNVDLRVTKNDSYYQDAFYDLDLHYITERIIAMSFPSDGQEASYRNHMKDLARMLQTKHGHNYMVLNLSERQNDLRRYHRKVLEFGWPENLAPPLERLCSLCKEIDSWLNSDAQRVVVLHCKGKKGRTGVVVASFMHYCNICASADQALDRFAMKRFYEDKLGRITQPSQKRYVNYFAGLLTGAIKINSSPLFLHQIVIHGVPTFDERTNGCRPFLKIYLAMEPVHTSGVYNFTDNMKRICFNVEPGLQLRGDVLIKAFHKRPHQQARDVIFRTQFHTCAISKYGYSLCKTELDDACNDRRFPPAGKVELLFSPGPQKQGPHFYHDPPPLLVDDSRDTILRWDSYSDFNKHSNQPDANGDAIESELVALDNHVQGPLDGSLYATVSKRSTVTKETSGTTVHYGSGGRSTSSTVHGSTAPVLHIGSSDIDGILHNSMDSGISSTTGVTSVSVSVSTSQAHPSTTYTTSTGSTSRHTRAYSAPRHHTAPRHSSTDQDELDAVLTDLIGSDNKDLTSSKSRKIASYESYESKSSNLGGGYVKRSYAYSDSADPTKNVSKTEYSENTQDAINRLLSLPAGYRQSPKADALDLAVPTENSHTWLEEQQRKLKKSHGRPRTDQERQLVRELKDAQDKLIKQRSNYYTYVDDQSGYMSEPEGSSHRYKRYPKGYEPQKYNTLQYSTTLVTDVSKPPRSPGLQRSVSPAVPSRTSSKDVLTRSRSATRGEWSSQNRSLVRQNSDLSHVRYRSASPPQRPPSPTNYRLYSTSSTLDRSPVIRTLPHSRSTSFTYEPKTYTEQRILMRNMPKQQEDVKMYVTRDRVEEQTEDPIIYSQEDLENELRQLEELPHLTVENKVETTRAPPEGRQDLSELQTSFGSDKDSSVSSLSREVYVNVDVKHVDGAGTHNISASSISPSDKVHLTTPTYIQAVRVNPAVNLIDLQHNRDSAHHHVTTCTRTIKQDQNKVSDEAVKRYNSLGERLEELERSLQAAQNAISAEAALRREKEAREAREREEKERLERERQARERMDRDAREREEKRVILERIERETIEKDTERLLRETRDLERERELNRREMELKEKERRLQELAAAPPKMDEADSGTRTITRTYMVDTSRKAVESGKPRKDRRRSSLEDVYLLKPIGVHALESDELETIHDVRESSTPLSATLPASSGGTHKVVEATVHHQYNSLGRGDSTGGGGDQGHHYSTIQSVHRQPPEHRLMEIHQKTTETKRTESPHFQSTPKQRHLESQRFEGRRVEDRHVEDRRGSPAFDDHYELKMIKKEQQEQGPEVFVESGSSSLNQSFETGGSSAGGSVGYTNEARNASNFSSLPHHGRMNTSSSGGVHHEHYSKTISTHHENTPMQYQQDGAGSVHRGGYSYSMSSQLSGQDSPNKSVSYSESSSKGGQGQGHQSHQYSWSTENSTSGIGSRMHKSYSESNSGGPAGEARMNQSWSEGSFSQGGSRSMSESGGHAAEGYSYQYSSHNGAQSPPMLTVDTSMVSHTRSGSTLSSNSQMSPASPNSMQIRSQMKESGGNFLCPPGQGSPAASTYAGMSRQASMQSLAFIDTVDMINHTPKFVRDLSKYWYKPNITREEAITLLKDRPEGTFVVRDSNSFPGAFGLALKVSCLPPNVQSKGDLETELVRHFLIESTSKGVRMKGCNNEPVFASLSTLVYQHTITPLALPCKLVLPESAELEVDDTDSKELAPGSAQALLAQGAACNVLYIHSVDTESLTGPQALARAMAETKRLQPKTTEVHFKVSTQGITLTDNLRKLFFRRHYPVNTVTYCGMDPDDTRWLTKQENGKEITAKVFGFVARKTGSQTDNSCHIFAELDPDQPASAIVNFVTKIMIGSQQMKKS